MKSNLMCGASGQNQFTEKPLPQEPDRIIQKIASNTEQQVKESKAFSTELRQHIANENEYRAYLEDKLAKDKRNETVKWWFSTIIALAALAVAVLAWLKPIS